MKRDGKNILPVSKRYWESMGTVWAGAGERRKRGLRILPKGQGYFVHVTSRTRGQSFLFGDQEKRIFVKMMRSWAAFSGLSVITHCLMDNHFHALLWVPAQVELDHAGILSRLEGVWPEEKVAAWQTFYQKQDAETRGSMDQAVRERMADLPEFMRVLKQSFTTWYNRKNGMKGTLWDSRYRSVVVEGSPLALMSVAAYIDLNPLRAGMVDDPMSYVWSGYGAAMGGDKMARKGLDALVRLSRGHLPYHALEVRRKQLAADASHWRAIGPEMAEGHLKRAAPKNWQEVHASYRIWLVHKGEEKDGIGKLGKNIKRKGLDPVQVLAEYEAQGRIPLRAQLQCRIRSFTRGVALGSEGYLENLFQNYRSCFGPERKRAARRVKGIGGDVMSLRQAE
jgi:putative transposase